MELTLIERQILARLFARKYRLATKSEKRALLDEFTEISGLNRNYTSRLLSKPLMTGPRKSFRHQGRRTEYDSEVRTAVEKIWEILDHVCSKRLVGALPEMVTRLEHFGEVEFKAATKTKLSTISASTVERLLGPARKKLGRRGASMTKSGKYLIDRIPIKTFGEWKDTVPGFVQMDLVAHNGGNVFGGFLHTLSSTDIGSGWTVCTLVRNKTEFQMLKALINMRKTFPFPLRGMHSDNGSEFINEMALKFAARFEMKFTRSRPYKKNDCAHIEQKNYSIIRRMRKTYKTLNPAELKRKINNCQKRLIRSAAPLRAPTKLVKVRRPKEMKHTTPRWRRNGVADLPNPFLERQRMEELRRAADTIRPQRGMSPPADKKMLPGSPEKGHDGLHFQ